jgi:hypothetical protein
MASMSMAGILMVEQFIVDEFDGGREGTRIAG